MVAGMLAAALFLGSSMIISARITPLWGDLSILGLAGYAALLHVGIRLLINISGKEKGDTVV